VWYAAGADDVFGGWDVGGQYVIVLAASGLGSRTGSRRGPLRSAASTPYVHAPRCALAGKLADRSG